MLFVQKVTLSVATLVAAAGLVGCGRAESSGPEAGVTVNDLLGSEEYFEGDYLGRRVTVSATVSEVLAPRSFELDGVDYGDPSLLVQTPEPVVVEEGQVLRVTGTVGQFHRLSEDDYAPGSYDLYEDYETEPYLYGATVEVLPGAGG